ncbi:carotenoid oxygenase family protein [Streptomyces collinus]|uniref:carotenoid oxygenase family protein n=1 Tax=Streptomyces collinus TaxID=42684 RepID=UPI003653AA6B
MRTRTLDDRPQKFPRANEALVSRRHRYGYSAAAAQMSLAYQAVDGTPPDGAFANALIKHDLLRGSSEVHRLPGGAAASEALFVPSDPCDGRAAEDDGYAVAYVHDPDRGASDLVILAAQDFTGEPVARWPGSIFRGGSRWASTGAGFPTRDARPCAMVDVCMRRTSSSTASAASAKKSTPPSGGSGRTS